MSYLYGASVQGIQDFIFQTNSLAEIVGASELVEEICTLSFVKMISPDPKHSASYLSARDYLKEDSNAVLNAAGNIKYIFSSRTDCEKVVREFPRMIYEFAPGVTISQAVVEITDGVALKDIVGTLEARLKIQRNKPARSAVLGLIGTQRSRQTGLPIVSSGNGLYLDKATAAKLYTFENGTRKKKTTYNLCKKAFGLEDLEEKRVPFMIDSMTSNNDWIAVIHADGNGLGNVITKIGSSENKSASPQKVLKDFSQRLDEATTTAAIKAYKSLGIDDAEVIPIRPIVLGGDDLTVICRADLALRYTSVFIREFEIETERLLGDILSEYKVYTKGNISSRLTACAGIAFVKSSFPFHYAYSLAEQLCSKAKADAKSDIDVSQELAHSCVMFHKVQGSYTGQYDDIVKRELLPQEKLSFCHGPYYLDTKTGWWTIDDLMHYSDLMAEDRFKAIRSRIRKWISLVYENEQMASQDLGRIKSLYDTLRDDIEKMTSLTVRNINDEMVSCCPAYDIMTVNTICTQVTKQM